jgi:hypothetical protein
LQLCGDISVEDQQIAEALHLSDLVLPASPRIVKLDWQRDEDSFGDESINIAVVLDNSTTYRELEKAPIHQIKGVIMDSLQRHGVVLFPYFYFEREEEYEPLGENS